MLTGREWIEHELIFLVRQECWMAGHESSLQKRLSSPFLSEPCGWCFSFSGAFQKLRICGTLTISLAKEGRDRVPQGRAHSLGTSDSLTLHTEVLISKQTACRCTVGQCFFWLPWWRWNGQAVVRLASEWDKGSWKIRVRLWMQVTANG